MGGGVRIFRTEQAFFWASCLCFRAPGRNPFALALWRSYSGPTISCFYLRAPALLVFRASIFALLVFFRSHAYIYMHHGGKPRQDRQNRLYVKHKLQYDSLKPLLTFMWSLQLYLVTYKPRVYVKRTKWQPIVCGAYSISLYL